jgi:hypothetical protein
MFIHIYVTSWEIDYWKPPAAARTVLLKLRIEESHDMMYLKQLFINNKCVKSNIILPHNERFTYNNA